MCVLLHAYFDYGRVEKTVYYFWRWLNNFIFFTSLGLNSVFILKLSGCQYRCLRLDLVGCLLTDLARL